MVRQVQTPLVTAPLTLILGLAGATAAAPAQLEALYGELLSTLESMRMDNLAAQLSAALCPYFSGLAQMSVLVHARSPKDLRDPLSQ